MVISCALSKRTTIPIEDGAMPHPGGCTPKGLRGVRLKDWGCTRNENGCTRRGALSLYWFVYIDYSVYIISLVLPAL